MPNLNAYVNKVVNASKTTSSLKAQRAEVSKLLKELTDEIAAEQAEHIALLQKSHNDLNTLRQILNYKR